MILVVEKTEVVDPSEVVTLESSEIDILVVFSIPN